MTETYRYCTRCGEELSQHLKEKYSENHTEGPVLCRNCLMEIMRGFVTGMNNTINQISESIGHIGENIADALNQKK